MQMTPQAELVVKKSRLSLRNVALYNGFRKYFMKACYVWDSQGEVANWQLV